MGVNSEAIDKLVDLAIPTMPNSEPELYCTINMHGLAIQKDSNDVY